MQVDPNSWHCKTYGWWYNHKYYKSHREYYGTKTQSNLCPYMRAVLIWAPMRALLWNWVRIGGRLKHIETTLDGEPTTPERGIPLNIFTYSAILIALPVLSHSMRHSLLIVYLVIFLVSVATTCLVSLILYCLKYKIFQRLLKPFFDWLDRVDTKPYVTFGKLTKEYLRSGHDRICPEINWEKK